MSTKYEATGTIVSIGATKQVSDKFRKREFVVEIPDGKYPQLVAFQLAQDKCDLLDGARSGSAITVHFNLKGREWTDPKSGEVKTFNTLDAWKVETDKSACQAPAAANSDIPF